MSPVRTEPAITACGTCRSPSWYPACTSPPPRDATRLREALARSLQIDDAPSVLRFSKEPVPSDLDAVDQVDGVDVLLRTEQPRVLVVAFGQFAGTGVAVGQRLSDQGIGVTVVDPVWALPVNPALLGLAADHELVISIEDNGVVGGCGARLAQELRFAAGRDPDPGVRHPAGVPRARQPQRTAGRDRSDPTGHRAVRR